MSLIGDLMKLVSRMPPEGLAILTKLVRALLDADDPMRAAKRAAVAAASAEATEQVIKRALKARGK